MPPFQWEDIDHSLVSLKLTESSEKMHRKIKEDEARIQFENRHNLNGNAVPSLVLRMKQEHADAQAQQVYEIYCNVWQTQGHAKSAAFVRAVSARAIRATLRARAGAIADEFLRFAKRTSFPDTIRDAHVLAHRLKMQRLQSRWERWLEAEAKECEHAERIESMRSEMPAGRSLAAKVVPEALVNAPADEIRREAWLRAMFETGYTYGWRHEELVALRVRQVNLVAGTIRLEPGTTKNAEGREVGMTVPVRMLLTQCVHGKSQDDYVFTRENGKPVRDFRGAWARTCEAAKVQGLLFHDLRRTAARNLRRAGVAEGVIMKIGGWKTRSVFERYAIVSQSDIRDAMTKLEAGQQRDNAEAVEQQKSAQEQFGQTLGRIEPERADSRSNLFLPPSRAN
jgi:integrase